MRRGIFGGSFDPVHMGHLILADVARESASLDQVLWIPAATSPLKPHGPIGTNRQRLEMLQLAIGGNEAFEVSSMEFEREGPSYTVETLEQLATQHPQDELFLIVGADSLQDFGRWKDVSRICEIAIPLVGARKGANADLDQLQSMVTADRLKQIREFAFDFPWIEISSSGIREGIESDRSIRYRLPRSVECYIENASLYRSREHGDSRIGESQSRQG